MNYQRELDQLLARLEEEKKVPRLLLHSCCAPCSSYVLEYLSAYFAITVFYYNPNIYPESEYTKRILEQQTLIGEMKTKHPVSFVAGVYEKEKFYEMAAGLEHVREGGERCMRCYELRLREAARLAEEGGYHDPEHQSHEERGKAGGDRAEAGGGIRGEVPPLGLQKEERLQAVYRAVQDLRPVQAGLLRLRIFPSGRAGAQERSGKTGKLSCAF